MRNYYEMFILCLKMYDHFVLGFFLHKRAHFKIHDNARITIKMCNEKYRVSV